MRVFLLLIAACAPGKPETLEAKAPAEDPRALRAVASFSSIADRGDRSRALFLEASRVFLHPRCANCHPSGDTPAQGIDMHRHDPPVVRGKRTAAVARRVLHLLADRVRRLADPGHLNSLRTGAS